MQNMEWKLLISVLNFISMWITNADEVYDTHLMRQKKINFRPSELHERRLYNYLFIRQSYDPLVRPVKHHNNNITIQFGIALIQLISIDERKQVLKTNVWLRLLWPDYHLIWNPTEFGNVTSLRVSPDHVWKPDLVLLNNADGKYKVTFMSNVVLYPDGSVLWVPPTIYRTSCSMDMHYFPFDEHICTLEFGSWTYNAKQVAFDWYGGLQRVDLNDYKYSGTWDVIECPAYHLLIFNNDTNSNDLKIIFEIKIRRKTLFYTINLILPCVFLEFLNVCVFLLPPASDEKMSFSIAIMLALVVFLLMITSLLPPSSSSIPLIAKFLLFTFMLNVVTSTITCIIINWNYRTPRTHYMHKWVKLVFLGWLPKILRMKRPGEDASENSDIKVNSTTHINAFNRNVSSKQCSQFDSKCVECGHGFSKTFFSEENKHSIELSPECRRAVEAIRYVAATLKLEDDYEEVKDDWKFIAMVIDRLQLIIFLIVTVGGAFGCIFNAPNIFETMNQDTIKASMNDTTGYIS